MLNDLIIKNVVRAYYAKHLAWERNRFSPRGADAIVLFTEGKIEYHFEGKTLTAGKGDFLLLPADLPYSGKKLADKCAFFVLDFESKSVDEIKASLSPLIYFVERYNCVAILSGANESTIEERIAALEDKGVKSYIVK